MGTDTDAAGQMVLRVLRVLTLHYVRKVAR